MESYAARELKRRSAKEVVGNLLAMEEITYLKLVVFLWNWWTERYEVNSGDNLSSVDEVQFRVGKYIDDFLKFYSKKEKTAQASNTCWMAPNGTEVKINIHATFREESR